MKVSRLFALMTGVFVSLVTILAQDQTKKTPSFSKDVFPVIARYCLPCHLAESDNASGLSLDNYETMMKGGKHGIPVVAGKPQESSLYSKLLPEPPFGRQMPRGRKKMTEEEIEVIYDWIAAGGTKDSTEKKPDK